MPTSSPSNQPRRALLLTGASRGIGHATVKRFSTAGWRVISFSRHPFPEDCPWDAGPRIIFRSISAIWKIPIGDRPDEGEAEGEGSRLHALVNNAANSPKKSGGGLAPIETSEGDWKKVFQVNFFGPIMLARGLMEELAAAKGAVVNVTSIAGSRVHPFAGAAYSTSKAALAALTREMAADFGPVGVRVNAISPGEIETSILSPGTEKIIPQIPQRRLGQPEEVAKAIYFLCTDASSYVTGAELHINGGQHV